MIYVNPMSVPPPSTPMSMQGAKWLQWDMQCPARPQLVPGGAHLSVPARPVRQPVQLKRWDSEHRARGGCSGAARGEGRTQHSSRRRAEVTTSLSLGIVPGSLSLAPHSVTD